MNTLVISQNIFQHKITALDYLQSDAFEEVLTMPNVNWMQLTLSGPDNEEVFAEFLERFMDRLKQKFGIYCYAFEGSVSPKNKLRSRTKLFYPLRKKYFVQAERILEKELDVEENESLLAGIINIHDTDQEPLVTEIIEDYCQFVYAERFQASTAHDKLEALGAQLTLDLFFVGKKVEVNFFNLIDATLTTDSLIFTHRYNGKDEVVFTVYAGDRVLAVAEQLLRDSLTKGEPLAERAADVAEVEQMIERYYRDWNSSRRNI